MRRLEIFLQDELYSELEAATATDSMMTPQGWASEAVEAALATRRLPRVKPAVSLPRMVETMMRSRGEVECRTAGPMTAAEVPTLDDLDCLADIAG
jgi:hypothetical protein